MNEQKEVCLFVKDLDKTDREYEKSVRHFKSFLKTKGITSIAEVWSTFSLSLCVPLFLWVIFTSMAVFLLHLFIIFGVAYFSNHSPFFREHVFIVFNKFPSLVCWCSVIHHHWPQRPNFFLKSEVRFFLGVCSAMCALTLDRLF